MSRRPATITQADIARAIRAAKQEGATEVEIRIGKNASLLIRLRPPHREIRPKCLPRISSYDDASTATHSPMADANATRRNRLVFLSATRRQKNQDTGRIRLS